MTTTAPTRGSSESQLHTVAWAIGAGLVGLGCCWLLVQPAQLLEDLFGVHGSPLPATETARWRTVVVAAIVAGTVVGALTPFLGRRRTQALRHEVCVLAGASSLLGGASLAALHGTAWGFDGLYSDAGFRTEAVTRFADSPALVDYAYKGLDAYYPPMWPWLQGRVAELVGVAGWEVMKPTQVAAGLFMAPLAWLLWRRVIPSVPAAWVASSVAVLTASPNKPDQWLVLCLLLPWWLEVCRGLRRPEVVSAGALRNGVVLGLLLLSHTFFFAPFAIATIVGMLVDRATRRPVTPRIPAAIVTGVVGFAVAAPTWWHLAVARVEGLSGDDLQRRWSPVGFDFPPHPIPVDARGVMEAVAVVWLIVAWRRNRVAAELLLVVLCAYTFMVGGQLLQPWGVALLPEKAGDLIEAGYAAAAALALHAAWSARPRADEGDLRAPIRRRWEAAAAVVAIVGLAAAGQSTARGMFEPARPAQSMRYPDGSFPAGGSTPTNPRWHPWGVEPGSAGPSTDDVAAAWFALTGHPLNASQVVITARADVAALAPVHLYLPWKSIYSHPHGRFEERLEWLEKLQRCTEAECAYRVLRDNDFDAVDGLVLNQDPGGPYLSVAVDSFPNGWRRQRISLRRDIFRPPYFEVGSVGGVLVVWVHGGATSR